MDVEKIINALSSNDSEIAQYARISLCGIVGRKDTNAISSLIVELEKDNRNVMLIEALGNIASPMAFDTLKKYSIDVHDSIARHAAVWAISQIDDPRVISVLQEAAKDHEEAVSNLAKKYISILSQPKEGTTILLAFLIKAPTPKPTGFQIPLTPNQVEDKIRAYMKVPNGRVGIIQPRDWEPPRITDLSQLELSDIKQSIAIAISRYILENRNNNISSIAILSRTQVMGTPAFGKAYYIISVPQV
jgi:hypothetical protein